MLVTAVAFWQVILAVHIAAVVVAFGVTFAYPLILAVGSRLDPRALPWFHRVQVTLGQRLVSPGLVVILAAGIYLASKLHQWSTFYVQWGLGVTIVLGALGGLFYAPHERKLAELAERDVNAAADGEVRLSEEYLATRRRYAIGGWGGPVLILITAYLMTVQTR
jgi:hypothetical protein